MKFHPPLSVLHELFLVSVRCFEFCREITQITPAPVQAWGRWIDSAKVQRASLQDLGTTQSTSSLYKCYGGKK